VSENLVCWQYIFGDFISMHLSANYQAPPNALVFLWSCEGVYHKQEVCFLLFFSPSDCHLTIQSQIIGLKLTMHWYKSLWLTAADLSIIASFWTWQIYYFGLLWAFIFVSLSSMYSMCDYLSSYTIFMCRTNKMFVKWKSIYTSRVMHSLH